MVTLEVLLDAFGKVQEVKIKQGLSEDCNNEAKTAFVNASQSGFSPAVWKGKAWQCWMTTSVGFWLE